MFLPWFWTQLWAVEAAAAGGEPATAEPGFWDRTLNHLELVFQGAIGTLVFGLLGILLALVGFKAFDWLTPRIDIQRELGEKHNIAVAILVGAVLLGVCHIIAQAVK
jgi:uncharacterized protein DUF350